MKFTQSFSRIAVRVAGSSCEESLPALLLKKKKLEEERDEGSDFIDPLMPDMLPEMPISTISTMG